MPAMLDYMTLAQDSPLAQLKMGNELAHAILAAMEAKAPGKVRDMCRAVAPDLDLSGPQNRVQDDVLYGFVVIPFDGAGNIAFDPQNFFAQSLGSVNNTIGTINGIFTNLKTDKQLPQGAAFTAKRIGFDIDILGDPAGDGIFRAQLLDALWTTLGYQVNRGDNFLDQGQLSRYPLPGKHFTGILGNLAAGAQTSRSGKSADPIGWRDMREWKPARNFDAGTFQLPVITVPAAISPFPNVAFANAVAVAFCYMVGIWSRPIPSN